VTQLDERKREKEIIDLSNAAQSNDLVVLRRKQENNGVDQPASLRFLYVSMIQQNNKVQ
jgi:hypothetical protein